MEEAESESELEEGEAIFVGTQEALAAHLGVERKSIQRWSKRKQCPQRVREGFNVQDWRDFMVKDGLGRTKAKSADKGALECEKLALENERRKLINAKLRGEVLSSDEVCKTLSDMMAGFVLRCRKIPNDLAQEVVGLSPGEAIKRMRKAQDEALEQLALGDWAKKKAFWSRVYVVLRDQQETYNLGSGRSGM